MKRILIVEDDRDIAELERDYLEADGFSVDIASDGDAGKVRALAGGYSLILLDVMLPGMDGFALCRTLRSTLDIPILMVSARIEDVDKIRALGLGADDYIIKPFSPSELAARVKAHIARYARLTGGVPEAAPALQFGTLEIQPQTRRVYVGTHEVQLAAREFDLLLFLAQHPQIVCSKEMLYDRVWGLDAMGNTSTVSVHMNRLREKIEPNPAQPHWLQTVWGAGYRFNAAPLPSHDGD
ncbi:response regulator transcription factor [uncultured Selenomonas sp.]|uniref:response regulator transcription factor n=1 Tax=uncultured Selenomonas sp. TaxID=159275 RepID=UPI0028D74CDE|nr:response regulator transcription factor [uncultured Selenomonas sp.]